MKNYGPSSTFSAELCSKGLQDFTAQPGSILSVPSKVLKANRDIYKPGTARMATSYMVHSCTQIHCTARMELEQQDPPFGVIVHMGVMDGDIHQYRAVVSQAHGSLETIDCTHLCQFTYGQLVATIKPKS
ncbi:hypothetical protein EMCRGX_G003387 [Ephydatia muelleri]